MNEPSTQVTGMLPAERRTVTVVALIAVLRMFGLFALLPVLAIYASSLDYATPALIGTAVGGYGLTQAVLQIPYGAASDRLGRVPVIAFGLLLFAAGSVLAALSHDIYGVIAGRMLQGSGAISATLSALVADGTRPEVRTRSMALLGIGIGASFLLAFITGPIIAAFAGVRSLFFVGAACAGVAALALALLPRGIARPEAHRGEPLRRAFRADLLRLDAYVFALHAVLTASFVALPFLLRNEIGLPLEVHWRLYIGAVTVSLLGAVPLILADERQGKRLTVSIAVLLICVAEFVLAFASPHGATAFAALAVFFAGFNFLEAALPARLSVRASGSLRGASLGVFSSAQFLGAFAGGAGGGWLLGANRPYPVFLACAIVATAWLAWHVAFPPVE